MLHHDMTLSSMLKCKSITVATVALWTEFPGRLNDQGGGPAEDQARARTCGKPITASWVLTFCPVSVPSRHTLQADSKLTHIKGQPLASPTFEFKSVLLLIRFGNCSPVQTALVGFRTIQSAIRQTCSHILQRRYLMIAFHHLYESSRLSRLLASS